MDNNITETFILRGFNSKKALQKQENRIHKYLYDNDKKYRNGYDEYIKNKEDKYKKE
jgi:hypothetical protein